MRNLIEYPITKEEIIKCLDYLVDDHDAMGLELACGSMQSILLKEAIKHVRGSTLKLSDLGTVSDNSEGMGSG